MEEEYFFSTGEFPKTISEKSVQVMDGLADAVVKTVKVSEIFPDPEKPPKKYPEDELAKLAIDILSNGLKNPLTVAPSKPAKRERYRILSGEKRFRACLLAHIEKVPCTIILPRKQKDTESELIMPPRNYFEQARLIREAICRNLYTEETIAGAAGVSRENVKSLLSLLIFSSDEQNLLLDVGIPKSTAIKLASADKKTREIFINALVGGKDPQRICALIDKSLSPYQSKKKVKFGIKSSGFLLNSINHAVETMREGGMDIGFTTKENDVSTVLTLTVPKDGENVPRGTSK